MLATAGTALLSICLAAACSSGSGSSGNSSAGQTLTVFTSATGGGAQGQATQDYYNLIASKFHAQTGATLKYQYWSSSAQENSIIQTGVVSSSGPDVIIYGSSSVVTLAALNAFHVFTTADWKALGGRNSFIPAQLTMSGDSPSQDIGIPAWSTPYVIAYNSAMFAKAGISAPPTTWDQYITDAQKVMKANPGVYGAGIDPADPKDAWKFIWSYTHQLGGSWATGNGKQVTINTAQTQQAVDFYVQQSSKFHLTPPGSLTWNHAQMVSAFVAGKVAMIPIADEAVASAAEGTSTQNDIRFAELPSIPYGMSARPSGGTPAEQTVAGAYLAVPNYAADKVNLVLDLAKVMMSAPVETKAYQLLGALPVTNAGLAMIDSKYPSAKQFAAAIGGSEPTEITPAWNDIETGISGVINRAAASAATSGTLSPQYVQAQLAAAEQAAQAHASS